MKYSIFALCSLYLAAASKLEFVQPRKNQRWLADPVGGEFFETPFVLMPEKGDNANVFDFDTESDASSGVSFGSRYELQLKKSIWWRTNKKAGVMPVTPDMVNADGSVVGVFQWKQDEPLEDGTYQLVLVDKRRWWFNKKVAESQKFQVLAVGKSLEVPSDFSATSVTFSPPAGGDNMVSVCLGNIDQSKMYLVRVFDFSDNKQVFQSISNQADDNGCFNFPGVARNRYYAEAFVKKMWWRKSLVARSVLYSYANVMVDASMDSFMPDMPQVKKLARKVRTTVQPLYASGIRKSLLSKYPSDEASIDEYLATLRPFEPKRIKGWRDMKPQKRHQAFSQAKLRFDRDANLGYQKYQSQQQPENVSEDNDEEDPLGFESFWDQNEN
ncbi:hypothetical protein MIR68_000768 [Amoeboaphelidium protococcarum]|nr:hypothetical protein MIR68_000768 [Amoeboaphelidium protococcarum]